MAINLQTKSVSQSGTQNQTQTSSNTDFDPKTPLDISKISEEDSIEFLETLIQAITGVRVEDIPTEKREEVATKCMDFFSDFIYSYIEKKYGKGDVVKLKAARNYGKTDIFMKFSNLQAHYFEAYDNFVDFLESKTIAN